MTYPVANNLTEILGKLNVSITGNKADLITKTGFEGLDRNYFGIAPRELWIVGGYTSAGKSFFLSQLLLNITKQNKKVLLFSLEMSTESIAARLWGNYSGLSPAKIEWGNLNLEESTLKNSSLEELKQDGENIYIVDDIYSIKGMIPIIESIKPDFVFIDYLQNLQANTDEYQKLTSASAQLQLLAKKYDCAFVCASQVSNEEQKIGVNNTSIIGLKGSGAIAASADFVVWLEKKIDYTVETHQYIDVFVRKSRRGPVRKFDFELQLPSGKFVERKI